MSIQKYPIGLQDFKKIREADKIYLDKTKYIHEITQTYGNYFLSRPRRFGKSLLISTLAYLYRGKKELFKGLYIEDKWDWTKIYPVIEISFNTIGHVTLGLEKAIDTRLHQIAEAHGVVLTSDKYDRRFQELIEKLSVNGKVVVLIDEYDKPILDYLGKETVKAIHNRDIMKSFYSVLKNADGFLQMVFITGVTKFSKVSIFSELNNLTDLTMQPKYAGMCGVTQKELEENFVEELKIYDQNEIKRWYNGYTWDSRTKVYNPFSLLNFFAFGEYRNFWFETGTPTFLVNLMLDFAMFDIEEVEVDGVIVSEFDIENLNPYSVLFQAGYLTIKAWDAIGDIFTLVPPNLEVRRALQMVVLNAYRRNDAKGSGMITKQLYNALKNDDLDKLKEIFNKIMAGLPYDLWEAKREKTYHAIIHLTFMLAGLYVHSEVHTSNGRLDSVIEFDDKVYLFEFKLDKSAQEALHQIEEKGYANRYKTMGKTCVGIGINFIQAKREVEEVLWKQM
jgi:hypothetical protein